MSTELEPIELKFPKPREGYWDGGKRAGGTFEPREHEPDDTEHSFVRWDCWGLNFWFTQPGHNKNGRKFTAKEKRSRAVRFIRHNCRVEGSNIS